MMTLLRRFTPEWLLRYLDMVLGDLEGWRLWRGGEWNPELGDDYPTPTYVWKRKRVRRPKRVLPKE